MLNLQVEVQDDTKKKIIEVLQKLGGAAARTAEHLWSAACQATFARGLAAALGFAFMLMALSVAGVLIVKRVNKSYPNDPDTQTATTVAVAIFGLIIGGFLTWGVFSNLSAVIAPEGETIFTILGK